MKSRLAIAAIMTMLTLINLTEVRAQNIESLVMPGDVVESHADIETECGSCHVMFDRQGQDTLCVECHEDVGADIAQSEGFHGLSGEVQTSACSSCHTDHAGRDADIVNLDEASFDHDFTDFALIGGHLDAACGDCHAAGTKHRDAPGDCASCHVEEDPHQGFMGESCGDCHSPIDWQDVEFDHDTTGYVLLGGHTEPACGDCHADQTFQNAPTTCFGCHADDDVHSGRSGEQCENCHNPTSWTDSSFDHARDTSFVLDGRHGDLTCTDCHSDDPFADELESSCVSCHLEDDEHDGHFGAGCETCHSTVAWTDVFFDHDTDTDYEIHGAHVGIACEACHIEPVFEVALKTSCNDCHAPDDPHEGEQGIVCDDCHNESSWQDDVFFDHDLTRFPLLGKHSDVECDDCHATHVFRDAPEQCVDCHAEDDPHNDRFSENCASCHNPVDWLAWQFDHDTQTTFPLSGAHADVSCDACHRQPLSSMNRLGSRCADCHRADDIHDGEFGSDCGRCHSADSFREVRSIQ